MHSTETERQKFPLNHSRGISVKRFGVFFLVSNFFPVTTLVIRHFSVFGITLGCGIWIVSFSENTELCATLGCAQTIFYPLSGYASELCVQSITVVSHTNLNFPMIQIQNRLVIPCLLKPKCLSLAWCWNWNEGVERESSRD